MSDPCGGCPGWLPRSFPILRFRPPGAQGDAGCHGSYVFGKSWSAAFMPASVHRTGLIPGPSCLQFIPLSVLTWDDVIGEFVSFKPAAFLGTQIFWDPMNHRPLITSFLPSQRLALFRGNTEITTLDLFFSPAQNNDICFLGYVSSLSCQRHLREIKCSSTIVLSHTSHVTYSLRLLKPHRVKKRQRTGVYT